ncbi:MAG: hypothetical protein ABID38_03355 [Candidatus Diapherotrites archaeon]
MRVSVRAPARTGRIIPGKGIIQTAKSLFNRKSRKKKKKDGERRTSNTGPAGRRFRNWFSKKNRFGEGPILPSSHHVLTIIEAEMLGNRGAEREPLDEIERNLDGYPKKVVGYIGPQFAEIQKENNLFESVRKRLKIRKEDSIEITPAPMEGHISRLFPVEGIFIRVTGSGHKPKYFVIDYSSKDENLFIGLVLLVQENIIKKRTILFPTEKIAEKDMKRFEELITRLHLWGETSSNREISKQRIFDEVAKWYPDTGRWPVDPEKLVLAALEKKSREKRVEIKIV